MTKKLLMGNEAFAHAALEAGVRVVAGYPGTPSSELVETVAKLHAAGAAEGVHVEWSTNEKAALEVLYGASCAGARVLFTCKQVGLNVASDPLLCLNYLGVRSGTVLFVADDPGPISSQTEQDTRRFASFAKVPVLDPANPEQGFAMMQTAFELSERFRTPVIVRPTTRIDHASTFMEVAEKTQAAPVPDQGFEKDPKWVIFPKRAYAGHAEVNQRLTEMAHAFSTEESFAGFNAVHQQGENPTIGIVAGGVSVEYAQEALDMLQEKAQAAGVEFPAYRFMQIGTPYPFPDEAALKFSQGLERILVFEELDYVIEDAFVALAGRAHAAFDVFGKLTGDARDRGENDADDIAARIARFVGLDELAAFEAPAAYKAQLDDAEVGVPVRPPVLCAGCPHRGSFYEVKRALGKREAVLCGDIGCYTLGNAKPLDAVDTCLCMGAGITMAQGLSIVDPGKKQVAFVGDSTFFASGMTGLANAVYNGHDVTVVVLDNATTAMTGSQPHPGTGVTLMGERRKPISIEKVVEALGVECIVKTDPLNLEASIAAVSEAIDFPGPSVVLSQSPCIQLKKPEAAAVIDTQMCTGCKKCITEIGCPGIGFDPDVSGPLSHARGQAFVDASLCNGCGLCVQVCPFGALSAEAWTSRQQAASAAKCEGGCHA